MKYIGKIAEIRVNDARSMHISVRAHREMSVLATQLNSRGGGALKMALGDTHGEIERALRHELLDAVKTYPGAAAVLDFRVNCNEIRGNLVWEGFGIQTGTWLPLVE